MLLLTLLAFSVQSGSSLGAPSGVDGRALRALRAEIEVGLESLGAPLAVVDVIQGLETRYGAFADLDGDGDLDYVATEMSHQREQLALHLRGAGGRWRRSSVRFKPFGGLHPLYPWVVQDDGSGAPAVLLPTGWPPYLFQFPTDGAGRFRGEAISLGDALPERVHTSGGVDDMPYEITSVLSAGAGNSARILGRMEEPARRGVGGRFAEWEITLGGGEFSGRSIVIPDAANKIDWGNLPVHVRPVEQPLCGNANHDAKARRSIMASKLLDLDGDGIRDLVHFSGDFAAHVFLGKRDAQTGVVSFAKELPGAEPLPYEDASIWFWDRMETFSDDEAGGYASNAGAIFEKLDFVIETPDGGDARVLMYGRQRKSWLVEYFWTGKALIPLVWYRHCNPSFRFANQDGWFQRARVQITDDWDSDGAFDTLVVAPFRAMRWIGKVAPEPGGISFAPALEYLEPYRYGLVYLSGAERKPVTTLCFAPRATGIPEDRHKGLPMELTRVPIFRDDAIVAYRLCLLVRSLHAGIFLAPTNRANSESTPFETWLRRGQQAFVTDRYYVECDAKFGKHPEEACVPSGVRTPRGYQRALWFFEQALPLAQTELQRVDLQHLIARCHSRTRNFAGALGAYAEYARLTGSVEPLNSAHSDLTWLFSQPRFRDWHAWRSKTLELRVRPVGDLPGRD